MLAASARAVVCPLSRAPLALAALRMSCRFHRGASSLAQRRPCACAAAGGLDDSGVNLYHHLGQNTIHKFSTAFYDSVYSDTESWFRDLFNGHPKEGAIQNQYEFLVQRFGGPHVYSERKGHPMMQRRHAGFPCNDATAARWLHHMEVAFEAVPEIDPDSRSRMTKFFRSFAARLVDGQAEGQGRCGAPSWQAAQEGVGPESVGWQCKGRANGWGQGGMGQGRCMSGQGRHGGWGQRGQFQAQPAAP